MGLIVSAFVWVLATLTLAGAWSPLHAQSSLLGTADDTEPDGSEEDEEGDDIAFLQADTLTYDRSNNTVLAEGNVEVAYDTRVLFADKLIYNQDTDIIRAEGNIAILEESGQVTFAESAELKGDLKEGVVENIQMLLSDNSKFAANRATRIRDRLSVLNKAVFSPCKVCEDDKRPPLWQIKAYRVIHDQEIKEIRYQDAVFEVFGVPVGYFPYFSHPDPTVKRKSGFLTPSIGNSSDLGTIIETPYYFALSDHYDATVKPVIATDAGVLLQGEFRQKTRRGQYRVEGSITLADELDDRGVKTGETDTRGHIFANGQFNLSPNWNSKFTLEQATDDTFLERYDISEQDRLESRLNFTRIKNRNFLSIDSFAFRDLTLEEEPGQTPVVVPLVDYGKVFTQPVAGGQVQINANLLNFFRSDGPDVTRISGTARWDRIQTNRFGQVLNYFASVRSDGYFIKDSDTAFGPENRDTVGRVLPQVGLDVRWPFARHAWSLYQTIEPIVQVIYAPVGGNPTEIPNEDSLSFEFDDTNLFSRNRFPGLDQYEDGSRINYGLRGSVHTQSGGFAEFLIGQSYRFVENATFAVGTGLNEKNSDFVGRVIISPNEHIDLVNRFRLDRDDLSLDRNELQLNWRYWRLNGGVLYTRLAEEATDAALIQRQEISLVAGVDVTRNWRVFGSFRRDLQEKQNIRTDIGLQYEDECTLFQVTFRRDFTEDRDVSADSTVFFTIRLKNLG